MTQPNAFYHELCAQMEGLGEGSRLPLSVYSNCAALLWCRLERINWCGFYFLKDQMLYLGPFQGLPACTLIPVGKGVCGTCAASQTIQRVPDVHQFPGHIACDSASRSEIVLPLIRDGQLIGVMDIDSPELARFSEQDEAGLNALCNVLLTVMDRTPILP